MTTPQPFRKRPVVVEAIQLAGDTDWRAAAAWCGGRIVEHAIFGPAVLIHTLEGDFVAIENDWIIRGVRGEFYPCKPGIFAETYEPTRESA